MTLWFSSDFHLFHENIIKYGERPFSNVTEMNEFIIEQHNKFVKPEDHHYNLGDVTMLRDNQGRGLEILKRMNGHKRLIMGNHDHYHVKHYMKHFEKVMAMNRIGDLWFMHVPCHPSNLGSCRGLIHGHIHQNPSPSPHVQVRDYGTGGKKKRIIPYINISVEATNYRPLSLEEIGVKVDEAITSYQEDQE